MISNVSVKRMTQSHFAMIVKNSTVKGVKEDTRRERCQNHTLLSLLMMDGRWFLVVILQEILHNQQDQIIIALFILIFRLILTAILIKNQFVQNVGLNFILDMLSWNLKMWQPVSRMKSPQNWFRSLFLFLFFPSFPSFPCSISLFHFPSDCNSTI